MRRALALCLALGFALTLSGVAFAQQQDDDDEDRRRIYYRPVTNIDFGEKDIQGVLQGPPVKFIRGDEAPVFDPLMKTREHFNREIMQSVHEL